MRYTDENRGIYQNEDRARQLLRFDGMRYGNVTPTDVDCFWELRNKAFFYAEIKYGNAEVPRGQRLAFERQATRIYLSGAYSLLVFAVHQIHEPKDDVFLKRDAIVTEVFYNGKYRHIFGDKWTTVGECSDAFREYVMRKIGEK